MVNFLMIIQRLIFALYGLTLDASASRKLDIRVFAAACGTPVDAALRMAGGAAILSWAGIPTVFVNSDGVDEVVLYHEVGHVPDLKALYSQSTVLCRIAGAILSVVTRPAAPQTWAVPLFNWMLKTWPNPLVTEYEGMYLVLDAGFEQRADRYAAQKTSPEQMFWALLAILGKQSGLESDTMLSAVARIDPSKVEGINRLQIEVVQARLIALCPELYHAAKG